MTWLPYDEALVHEIATRMALRRPNRLALDAVARAIESGDGTEVVCDLATGVGKTYLAAALVEYLARKGVRNVLIVTPGTTIQNKTIGNFTPGHPKFVPGAEYRPVVITSDNFARGQVGDALHDQSVLKLFIFNVQQLIKPGAKVSRRVREVDEFIGAALYEHLKGTEDLVVIADEHHVYRTSARAFASAVRELNARALVGLTATPDRDDLDKVIYQFTLAQAIFEGLVKVPVIVYREDGIKDPATQLADACLLRARKEAVWLSWAAQRGHPPVTPVLFVVCQTIGEAERVAATLTGEAYLPGPGQVLLITSQSSDQALAALAGVEEPDSPVRAVVSVDKLKEGWDVRNIGVIVGFRALASQTLTEQILGRGLRLPFGIRVGIPAIDQVDVVAHDSYRKLLADKDALLERVVPQSPPGPKRDRRGPSAGALPFERPEPDIAGVQEIEREGRLALVSRPQIIDGEAVDGSELLQFASMEAETRQHEKDVQTTRKILYKVPGAPTIEFPRRERAVQPVIFSLSTIKNADATALGAGYPRDFPVHLTRLALLPEEDLHGKLVVRERRVEEEDATQRYYPVSEVRRDLEDRIWNLGLVEHTLQELNAASRIAAQFLAGAGVSGEDNAAEWSERRAHQAASAIADLVRSNYNMRRLQPQWKFRTVRIPKPGPMPDIYGTRWDEFVKHKWFDGWERSIQQAASFDAKTTEWALAARLDSSPEVRWWLRIYDPGEVWIERDSGGKYYPDFIVLDTEDVFWVVEGKADRDAERTDVLEKKRAAEEWARYVRDDGRYGIWRYIFATEKQIREAQSWTELLARTMPER
jgi:type III restriction enzyme